MIQYTYAGKLFDTYKNGLAEKIVAKWKGDMGLNFRKVGFKDIAIMITELTTSTVYSSRMKKWYTVDDYTALTF